MLEIQIIWLSEYRRRQKHHVVWPLSTGPVRKQKCQRFRLLCWPKRRSLWVTAASCWVSANTRTHCHMSWCTGSGQRQDCPQGWPLNQHDGIFSERLWERDVWISGWACAVSRIPMTSRQSPTSQTEKEKIRQSSLSFSLLKEEGGTEKDWRNLSFSLFSLSVSGPVKRMTRRPKLCLYCAVALFLTLCRWWITQTPASMEGINNSSDDYESLRICWVLNIHSESSHTLRLTDTACVILLPSLFLANYTAFKRPDPDVNNALFGQPKPV